MSKNIGKTVEELLKEALVPEEEQPYELPDNWLWVTVGTISMEIKNGTTLTQNKEGIGKRVTRIESIQNNNVDFNRIGFISQVELIKDNDYYQEGDIALSHINSIEHVGKSALIAREYLPLVHGMNLLRIRLYKDVVYPRYGQYFMRSFVFRNAIWGRVNRSVNQVSLNQKNLSGVPFPLPPFNEQKRIADKVEILLNKINQAKQLIEEAKETFELRRAAIFDKAFRGELTTKWRDENPVVETGRELLTKVGADINLLKKLENDSAIENGKYDLPNNWQWETLENLCYSITDGDHQAPPKVEKGIPFLVISNINTGELDLNSSRFVPREYYLNLKESRRPRKGDILYSVTGSIGIPVLVNVEEEFCFQRHIAILKPSKFINSEYLFYLMKSRLVYNQAISKATGTAQLTVPLTGLRKILVPVPPLDEQNAIVKEIARAFKLTENSDALQSEILNINIKTLQQSILSKAFRGELGTNESNESAAVSLLMDSLHETI